MTERFVRVEADNQPGTLGTLAGILGNGGVNITAYATDDNAVRFLTNDPDKTVSLLSDAGYNCTSVDVFSVQVPDEPGALAKICTQLGDAGVNIVSTFGCVQGGNGTLFVNVEDIEKATPILSGPTVTATR